MSLVIDNSVLSNKQDNDSNGNISNSDNPNDNGKRTKTTRNRPCKSERFEKEREKLIKEINNIIGLADKDFSISINKLEKMEILKNKLNELMDDIKRYYKCGSWGYVIAENKEKGSGNIITLLKSIYENSGYKIYSKQKVILNDGIKSRGTVYFFEKKS
jgi:hypothetical protein